MNECDAGSPEEGEAGRIQESQVFLIERQVTDLHGRPVSAVAALGVASPEPGQAGPADLARYVREQWSIESLHWVRDTLD